MTCKDCGKDYTAHAYATNVCLKCYKRIVPEMFWPKGLKDARGNNKGDM